MVNVPSPVVPYVPKHIQGHGSNDDLVSDGSIWQKLQHRPSLRRNQPDYQTSDIKIGSAIPNTKSQRAKSPFSINANQKQLSTEKHLKSSAADFSSFKATNQVAKLNMEVDDYEYDEGYQETDRIDVPSLIEPYAMTPVGIKQSLAVGSVGHPEYPNKVHTPSLKSKIDHNALVYSSKTAPYGQQFPSYVPHSIATVVGSTLNTQKQLSAGDDIVYGRGRVIESNEANAQRENSNDKSRKSSDIKNIFMKNDSFIKQLADYDYSEYYEYIDDEDNKDYADDTYDERDVDNLKKQLLLLNRALHDPLSESLPNDLKDDMLPELVTLWKETIKRNPKTDMNR